jgi:diaminopimelate epimerase
MRDTLFEDQFENLPEHQLEQLTDLPFAKMTGSGNDFVFFDSRDVPITLVTSPQVIQSICNRHNGIGADGVVVLEGAEREGKARIHYFNSDGSAADLCGNATLCSTTMSVELGLARADGMSLSTPAGEIRSRIVNGLPEIDLQPVREIRPTLSVSLVAGEDRIGFATAGIPHLVVLCDDADSVDLTARGPELRHHAAVGPSGANVNWVSRQADGSWRYRTYERGVEGETQACGTGAVATAVLLATWGLARSPVSIRTSSGRDLVVSMKALPSAGSDEPNAWQPTLRGEGRVVFRGRIATLAR